MVSVPVQVLGTVPVPVIVPDPVPVAAAVLVPVATPVLVPVTVAVPVLVPVTVAVPIPVPVAVPVPMVAWLDPTPLPGAAHAAWLQVSLPLHTSPSQHGSPTWPQLVLTSRTSPGDPWSDDASELEVTPALVEHASSIVTAVAKHAVRTSMATIDNPRRE
jgi:hypothetical protein